MFCCRSNSYQFMYSIVFLINCASKFNQFQRCFDALKVTTTVHKYQFYAKPSIKSRKYLTLRYRCIVYFWEKKLQHWLNWHRFNTWAPAGMFPERAQPHGLTKVAYLSARTFMEFCTETTYDVIIFKFHGGNCPKLSPLQAPVIQYTATSLQPYCIVWPRASQGMLSTVSSKYQDFSIRSAQELLKVLRACTTGNMSCMLVV